MRMKQKRLKAIYLRAKAVSKDSEGIPVITYGEPFGVRGEVWQADSKLQVETYGDRVNGMLNIRLERKYTVVFDDKGVMGYDLDGYILHEGDAVMVYADAFPDYKVTSVKKYQYLLLEVERI